MTSSFGYGNFQPGDASSQYNILQFLISQALLRVRTAVLAQVQSVTTSGGLSPVGLVDALPLVQMVDGNNNSFNHQTVFNLCYFRLQGGQNAIIMDPQVNDIGVALICDRDISSVKSSQKKSPPGSGRVFNLADGIFFGCVLSQGNPNQYVQFNSNGVTIADNNGNQIQMANGGITIVGNLIMSGNLQLGGAIQGQNGGTYTGAISTTGEITALSGASSVTLGTHRHLGVQTGSGQSGSPVPGS